MRTQIASVILLAMLTPSAASPDALADRVAALTKPFKGTVVFYAKNLKTGKDFGVGADTKVKTASTIKLPILCTLESLVAQGKVRWDERIVLKPEDKVTGSGVLGSLADGTDLTVRNLAILMIIVSDNTATNLILDRITADAVNEYLDSIGIHQTRSNRKVRGDGTQLKEPTGWSRAGLLEENKKYGLGVTHGARDGAAAGDARAGEDRQRRGLEGRPGHHEDAAGARRHFPAHARGARSSPPSTALSMR